MHFCWDWEFISLVKFCIIFCFLSAVCCNEFYGEKRKKKKKGIMFQLYNVFIWFLKKDGFLILLVGLISGNSSFKKAEWISDVTHNSKFAATRVLEIKVRFHFHGNEWAQQYDVLWWFSLFSFCILTRKTLVCFSWNLKET